MSELFKKNNHRLLIVDDEPSILQGYMDFLQPSPTGSVKRSSRTQIPLSAGASQAGVYQIILAKNGEEALELAAREISAGNRIAGGFFDVKMEGGIDGLQTIQELWKLDPDLHCTVVTAYHDRSVDDIDQLFGPRFNDQWDYLNKPFTQAEIVQKARQMVAAWNRKRMLELAQEQLVRSERMAAIGQVARAVGHEFGNLLQTMMGKADLAILEKDADKVRDKLKLIIKSAERASLIVRNLQSFSRFDSKPEKTSLPQVIKDTLLLVNHELSKNSVEVDIRAQDCFSVMANPAEIEQVLLNLLFNAIHAMPGGGRVEIGCQDEGESVVAWVRDNGTGIAAEHLPKIFEHAFTTKGERGSGLGLAISREIVERHGGRMEVATELGKGTMFTLRLPRIS